MGTPFDHSSRFYDLLYQEKDSASEGAYVHQLLQRYRISGDKLLEFGSGTGRHGNLLASLGYRVHGIERSEAMVSLARQTDRFTCQQGDISKVKLTDHYDGIISLFHVVSYQITNNDVQAVFANASCHLQRGGLFLFDVWYSPAVAVQRPQVRVKRIETTDLAITRIAEPITYPNANRVDVNYTLLCHDLSTGAFSSFKETHPMRHFSLPEIDLIAEVAGFERLAAEEWLTGNQPSEDTWGLCIMLSKK